MQQIGQIAVVVDGANLTGMKRALGGERVNYAALLWIARQVTGLRDFFPVPMVTIHPDYNKKGCGLYDAVKKAGFTPRAVPSLGGYDDEVVVSELVNFARQQEVKALVVVGCDHYEATELLQVARERRAAGNPLRGYLFGTLALNENGYPKTSPRIVSRFNRSKTVNFVDLSQYRTAVFQR